MGVLIPIHKFPPKILVIPSVPNFSHATEVAAEFFAAIYIPSLDSICRVPSWIGLLTSFRISAPGTGTIPLQESS